jgi:hypothetical protein
MIILATVAVAFYLVLVGALIVSDKDIQDAYAQIRVLKREKRQAMTNAAEAHRDAEHARAELARARRHLSQTQDVMWPAADQPIECLPVWTTGAPTPAIDEAFDELMARGFLSNEEPS